MPLTVYPNEIPYTTSCACGKKHLRDYAAWLVHAATECPLLRCYMCLAVLKTEHPFTKDCDTEAQHRCRPI